MKHNRLLLLLVLLGLVFGATPALASSVSLSQALLLTVDAPGLTAIDATSYTLSSASAYAVAGVTELGPFANGGVEVTAPGTASSSIPGVSFLGGTSGASSLPSNVMLATMSGTAPAPVGTLAQAVYNEIFLTFTANAAGSATVTISPQFQSLSYGVVGQTGYPFFNYLSGYSNLSTTIYSASNPSITANYQEFLADTRSGRFADFITSGTPMAGISFDLTNLVLGETVTLDLWLTTGYDAASQVPIPPSVWLFGSGLAGLLVWRKRKKDIRS